MTNLYLIDEPSAVLDSEQRIIAAKVMKRFVMNVGKSAFVENMILLWLLIWPTELLCSLTCCYNFFVASFSDFAPS